MNFNPKYITQDGTFETEINHIENCVIQEYKEYRIAKGITNSKIIVFNNYTKQKSEKSIYIKNGRQYFKGNHSYWNGSSHSIYYLDELKEKE